LTHPLIERLRAADPEARRAACSDAATDPSAVLLVDALCDVLADPEKRVARAASDALAAIGGVDAAVAERLGRALRQRGGDRPFWAAFTLARLGPPPIKLLPVLVDALEHAEGDIRWSAAKLLVELGRLEGEVLPVLLHFVASEERPAARRMAIFCLRRLAPDRDETAQALLAASRAPDRDIQHAAIGALASLLAPAAPVWQRLREAADSDADPAARHIATTAIATLDRRNGVRSA
jgi:HEAT repeat protein